ncbi:MAG: M56 family metallopeptidase [Solirubrobacterales bacterium]|nr:M56 family metallopeptidase [Solirubrobacterales bacterium]
MTREFPATPPGGGRVFWLAAVLGTAGMLAAASAVGALIGSIHRASMGVGRVNVLGLVLSYPALDRAGWLLIGPAALGATAITVAGRGAWRQRSAYRGLQDTLEVLGQLDGRPAVKVIAGSRPEAFCAGYLRPRVYISRGALELLTEAELEAVLAHEHHHRKVRDPLRFTFGRILSQALFFVPVMRSLRDRYADLAELNADRAAVRASAGRQSPLASALLVFDASAPPGASGISPERVDSLLGQPPRWRLPMWLLAASLAALSTLALLIWQASGPASVRATFNLPFLSAHPCVVMVTLLPLLVCVAAFRWRVRAGRLTLRRG